MSVYFATCRELGLVKIGHATDPKRRLQGFQTGCPKPLELEAQFDGGGKEERELHARFAEHRERGEWFRLCPDIESVIQEHKPAPPPEKYPPFEQGELVGPFRFDPKGWIEAYGDTPPEEWPWGVTQWLRRHPEEAVQ